MKPEAQRIAIAEACGWEWSPEDGEWCHSRKIADCYGMPPDYLDSLDAMHEAEKVLMDYCDGWEDYCHKLKRHFVTSDGAIRATAAQRAEAFLKTLSLWTE